MSTLQQATAAYRIIKTIPDRVASLVAAHIAERDPIARATHWTDVYKDEKILALRGQALSSLDALWTDLRAQAAVILACQPGPLGDPDPVVRELRTSRAWDRVKAATDAGRNVSDLVARASANRDAEMFAALLEFTADGAPESRNAVLAGIAKTFPDHEHAKNAALVEWGNLRYDEAASAISQGRTEVMDHQSIAHEVNFQTRGLASQMQTAYLTNTLGIPEPV